MLLKFLVCELIFSLTGRLFCHWSIGIMFSAHLAASCNKFENVYDLFFVKVVETAMGVITWF